MNPTIGPFKPNSLVTSRKSIGPSLAGGGASGPVYPTVTNSRLWLDRNRNIFTDTAGTTPAAVNDSIARWDAVGGDWGTDLLTQATSSKRPTLKADGIQCDGVDDYLDSSIAIGSDFTIYWVGSRTASNQNVFSVIESPSGNGIFKSDDTTHIYVLGTPMTYAGTSLDCVRIRRTGGALYMKRNGSSEQSVSNSSTMTATSLLGSPVGYGGSNSGGRMCQFVLVDRCVTPGDADDLAILGKLQLLEPTAVGP